MSSKNQWRNVWRKLTFLLRSEERLSNPEPSQPVFALHEVRVFRDDLDDLGGALADGVKERFLDAVEAEVVEQHLDHVQLLAVDGQVQGGPPHVVQAVHVEGRLGRLLYRHAQHAQVAQIRSVQVHALFVRQLRGKMTIMFSINRWLIKYYQCLMNKLLILTKASCKNMFKVYMYRI